MTSSKGKIIVFGILFYYPLAGVTYQFLHYLLGLRRLGYDPYYVEDSARWIYDPRLNDMSPDVTGNLASVVPALERYGLGDRWSFRGQYPGGSCYGLTPQQLERLYVEADAFLNVTGAQEIRDEHRSCPRRIYVESDPFVSQVKVAQGDAGMMAMLDAHTHHFSFGENIGGDDCMVPLGRVHWQPTRQPVDLELWPVSPPAADAAFNTITTWMNKGKDIVYQGETYYWTKDREFLQYLDLPRRRAGTRFEMAVTVPPDIRNLLVDHGWRQVSSVEVSADVDRYRSYIQSARGEFTVARDQYVRPRTGWFSDRTACYLAAGRPVITQETGFSKRLPTGQGLFGFEDMNGVLAAIDAIARDYPAHCRKARELAVEYFAAEKVVGSLLERAGF